MADYIPSRDADLDLWLNNFQALVVAAPATYGLTAPIGAALLASYTLYHDALVLATDPGTRTSLTVAAKDAQKILSKALFRENASFVRGNPAVTDADQLALGIPLRDPTPTPIPPPSTRPIMSVLQGGHLTHAMVWADETTPLARKKPAGVIGALVYRVIGTVPAVDVAQLEFVGLYTRVPTVMNYDSADVGKVATYAARWTNGKGDEGPWSELIFANVM